MAHYFTNDFKKTNEKLLKAKIENIDFFFYTDYNIFSKSNIDFGTKFLLENLSDIKGEVLDLGCGYGVIGIFLNKKFDCVLDMVDINLRAIDLTRKNIEINNVKVSKVFLSDAYDEIKKKYDYIISNPPIRVGKEKLYEILFGANKYLKKSGKLIFVIKKEQGAKSVIRDLAKIYDVKILNKKSGYFLIYCTKINNN